MGKHSPETREKMRKSCKSSLPEVKSKIANALRGKTRPQEVKDKISATRRSRIQSYKNWKGGVTIQGIALFDTYASRLTPVEETRRDPYYPDRLQVRCTYCGKWITPSVRNVTARINAIGLVASGTESRFYCNGPGCRLQCPIYKKVKHPKGYSPGTSREVQPELRKIVFERDDYACQKCSSILSLHCHHIDPVVSNPIESADIDNCITLCKFCHKQAHQIPGCSGSELRNCSDKAKKS